MLYVITQSFVFINFQIMTDFETSSRSCVCYSMKQYRPGEEFTIFYGQRPNCDLLINQVCVYVTRPMQNMLEVFCCRDSRILITPLILSKFPLD